MPECPVVGSLPTSCRAFFGNMVENINPEDFESLAVVSSHVSSRQLPDI